MNDLFVSLSFFLVWLGGISYEMDTMNRSFWDAIGWVFYLGKYIAEHFAPY